jgi:MFS family permease
MMALQTTFNRIGALAFGSSQFTFAMVVAVFVLCIAFGSLAVSALPRIPGNLVVGSQWALVFLLFPLYLGMGDATYWAHALRVLFRQVDPAFFAYYLLTFGLVLAVLAVPIGLSGALLPLLFHALRREVRDLGSVAGRLYAWNTVGSLIGALLGGYVLLFWLDLHHVYRIAMAALAVGATILTLLVLRPSPRAYPALILLPVLAAIWLMPPWPPERLAAGLFRTRKPGALSFGGPAELFARRQRGPWKIVFYDDDPTTTVAVSGRQGSPGFNNLLVNGKSDGALPIDYPTMALLALIPALMAEHQERSFVIGWGLGVSAGELAALDETREVEVAEISRGVIAAAPLFDGGNLAASKNPKVKIHREDAYRTLLRSRGGYDIIVSEPSNPWVIGVENLYSREFLEAARARLAPGGVFAQWFHLYEADVGIVSLVLRTYADVFPHVSVWFTLGSDLLLLGFDRPERALDVPALEARFNRADFSAGFARAGIESFPRLLAHELLPLGILHAVELEGEIHTLRHPILSYRAARAFFRGSFGWLPPHLKPAHERVAARNSLLRRFAGDGKPLPENVLEAAASESCRLDRREDCATFLARWGFDYPQSTRLQAALADVRKTSGGQGAEFTPASLGRLWVLFDGRIPAVKPEASLARAEALTRRFAAHYHHAVPFDRRVLETAWRSCQGDACEERRRQALERLGEPMPDEPAEHAVGQHLAPQADTVRTEPKPEPELEPEGLAPSRAPD